MKKRLFATLVFLAIFCQMSGQQIINLYNGPIPNSIESPDNEVTNPGGGVINVSNPTLTVYLPKNIQKATPAVIICPGGGYGSLMMTYEGNDVGMKLMEEGIAAFVLKYRLPNDKIMKDRSTGPLQDAREAIRMVREKAAGFNVDTSMVGIMGFSAGGHLAASSGILDDVKPALKPNFMILVYPVITMDTVQGHKGSTFNLLGNAPSKKKIQQYSLQFHVNKNTPPAFITVAANDDMLPSSLMLFNALKKNNVSCRVACVFNRRTRLPEVSALRGMVEIVSQLDETQ